MLNPDTSYLEKLDQQAHQPKWTESFSIYVAEADDPNPYGLGILFSTVATGLQLMFSPELPLTQLSQ